MIRGRGSVVDRGRMIRGRGGLVSRSRVIGSSLVFRVDSLSFVFHISNITVLIGLVRHNLHTAIRQVYTVFSSGVVVFTRFSLAESSARVGILHSISIGVHRGEEGRRGGVIGDGRSSGKSQKGCGEGDLKHDVYLLHC